jgi:hypothetical protein
MITFTTNISATDQEYNIFTEIDGQFIIDNDDTTKCVANIEACYIDVDRANDEGYCLDSIMDAHESAFYLSDAFHATFNKKGIVYKYLRKYGEHHTWLSSMYRNLLFINKVKVHHEARGKNYGLALIYHTIHTFARECQAVVLLVKPLQFSPSGSERFPELKLDKFTNNELIATKKIKKHYAKIGFEEIPKSNFMICNPYLTHDIFRNIGVKS